MALSAYPALPKVIMPDILTDSTADLSSDLLQAYRIEHVPLQVYIQQKSYLDGELSLPQLFQAVEQSGELPKTSAPPVSEFMHRFEQADEPIFIGISTQLSATTQNAQLAAQQLPGKSIAVINSLNLSTGIGLLVLLAAELRDQGCSREEIVRQVEAATPKIRTSFVIDTLDYLHKGGRCSAMTAIVGSLLSIRPVIAVQPDGTLGVKEKIRGSRRKALQSMLTDFQAHLPEIDLQRVFITHTGCDADAEMLKQALLAMAPIGEVLITLAGATVASHCGPNTIGILYRLK
jgi:DegV family protein with EDD domain